MQAPVLQYFEPNKEMITQYDASKNGLGACILQNEDLVIKKLLSITFAVEESHYFIYGIYAILQSENESL